MRLALMLLMVLTLGRLLSKKYSETAKSVKETIDEMKLNHYRQMQYLNSLEISLNASVKKTG